MALTSLKPPTLDILLNEEFATEKNQIRTIHLETFPSI